MRIATTTSLAVLIAATAAFAQDEVARKQAVEMAATRVPFEKAMTGAPYSAETSVEGLQVLADGNRIVRKTTGRVYRDSEGRTRREEDGAVRSITVPTDGNVAITARGSISIVDPVAGFSYSLDPERKIAWRTPIGVSTNIMGKVEAARVEEMKKAVETAAAEGAKAGGTLSAADEQKLAELKARIAAAGGGSGAGTAAGAGARGGGGRGGAISAAPTELRMRGTAEGYAYTSTPGPLERKTIEGVLVEGRKTNTIIPAGLIGNEQPLTVVSEEWRSPELNVLVLTRHSDPRTGESTYRLTNIVRAEPDRSLFMVPPDYEIKESGVRRMLEAKK